MFERFSEKMMVIGNWAGSNKYLGSIRNAFQAFMPFVIIGAIGTLWTSVIVNSSTGLGQIFPAIMALEFLNPIFAALNFCTIGCITIGVTFAIGMELGERSNLKGYFAGIVAIAAYLAVTNIAIDVTSTTVTLASGKAATIAELLPAGAITATLSAINTSAFGATGLFTGLIVGIISVELFAFFSKFDHLKIKLPDAVPSNVAAAFNTLIPACIALIIVAFIGRCSIWITGQYLNDLIYTLIQKPLQNVGDTYLGGLTFVIIISLFWCIGIHGNNMTDAVTAPLLLAMLVENDAALQAGNQATNIINTAFWNTLYACSGTGIALGIVLAVLLAGKRKDNRAVAKLGLIPACFNINEIEVFGLPVVLNPCMCIGFVLAPIASFTIGYFLTYVGFCPVMFVNVPWTTPPFLGGFLATGGNIMGGITQLLCLVAGTLIYIPCVKLYERQQNKADIKNGLIEE